MEPSFFERVYRIVRCIPRGKVASYSQIAGLLGYPRAARTVGWALNALVSQPAEDVPWQRVVNRAGRISLARVEGGAALQRQLLEEEGVIFGEDDTIDLRRFGWHGLDPVEVETLWLER